MKSVRFSAWLAIFLGTVFTSSVAGESGGAALELNIQMIPGIWVSGATGAVNIEYTTNLDQTSGWALLATVQATNSPYFYIDASATNSTRRFYRAVRENSDNTNEPPVNPDPLHFVLIPAGSFPMGDSFNDRPPEWGADVEIPVHTVTVSAFYMDKHEVTKGLWDEVKAWAIGHGYSFENDGAGRGPSHPIQTVDWFNVVKWCNARSEREGRVAAYYTEEAQTNVYRTGQVSVENSWVKWKGGYRLPTEAEWENAARGGLSGKRFPWGDTITHNEANYRASSADSYDRSSTRGYHPSYDDDPMPYTSPVGSFAPNGYGLYDMIGNVMEWCWDLYGAYPSGSVTDPRGPATGWFHMLRGGSWYSSAFFSRTAYRYYGLPELRDTIIGFRAVLPPGE